jgi:DNA mismatch repair protein MutL
MTAVFTQIALANPGVAFRLVAEGEEKMNLPAAQDPLDRIRDLYGAGLADSLLHAGYADPSFDVSTYFSNLDYTRGTRSHQLFFVNRRAVGSRGLEQGVRLGYRDLLPPGRFPAAFVFIRINPDEIDVNVHPTKKEIRFSNEQALVRGVSQSILNGFRDKSVFKTFGPSPAAQPGADPAGRPAAPEAAPALFPQDGPFEGEASPRVPAEAGEKGPGSLGVRHALINYYQLHNTYILSQIKNGMLIIDQHIAHERILYERALKNLKAAEPPAVQQLLFPVTVELSPAQKDQYDALAAHFTRLGFSLRGLSGNTLVVDGVPAGIKEYPVRETVLDILDAAAAREPSPADIHIRFARSFACGAAIKAGQPLSLEEINSLVDLLFQCENPYTCPHGRPIVIRVPLEEIARRFMRA